MTIINISVLGCMATSNCASLNIVFLCNKKIIILNNNIDKMNISVDILGCTSYQVYPHALSRVRTEVASLTMPPANE